LFKAVENVEIRKQISLHQQGK